jgi:hypothetical protein
MLWTPVLGVFWLLLHLPAARAVTRAAKPSNKGIIPPMTDKQKQPPTQKTAKGYEIPVPSKEDVMAFFKKVARATKKPY